MIQRNAVRCSVHCVLQCFAVRIVCIVRCSVLQCAVVYCSVLQCVYGVHCVLQGALCVAVCCNEHHVLQCVSQCIAVWIVRIVR